LATAALALVSGRTERQNRQRMDELAESRRRDAWRMRAELDEAHARAQRALERAIAAEAALHTLMATTENLLAVHRAMIIAAAAQPAAPAQEVVPVRSFVAAPEPSPIFEQAAAPYLLPHLRRSRPLLRSTRQLPRSTRLPPKHSPLRRPRSPSPSGQTRSRHAPAARGSGRPPRRCSNPRPPWSGRSPTCPQRSVRLRSTCRSSAPSVLA